MSEGDKNISAKPETQGLSSKNSTVPSTTWKEYIPGIPKLDETNNSASPVDKTDSGDNAKTADAKLKHEADRGRVLLQGNVQQEYRYEPSKFDGKSDTPKSDNTQATLQGSAKQTELDPDANNRTLLIAWDKWRNDIIHQEIQSLRHCLHGWDGHVYNRAYRRVDPRFDPGLWIRVKIDVDSHKHITAIEIQRTSGNKDFDQVVVKAVSKLDGKKILEFPTGSQRTHVDQPAQFRVSAQQEKDPTFIFNDFERVENKF